MSKGSHDCRKHCRGCGHIVDLVAGECPVCEYVHYVDEKKNDVEPQQVEVVFELSKSGLKARAEMFGVIQ